MTDIIILDEASNISKEDINKVFAKVIKPMIKKKQISMAQTKWTKRGMVGNFKKKKSFKLFNLKKIPIKALKKLFGGA